MTEPPPHVSVRDLCMAYGDNVVQRDLNFDIGRGEIFFIMGGSGCGKSTLLKHMIGLHEPSRGEILYHGQEGESVNYFRTDRATRLELLKSWGVSYQSGGLFSSMTLYENMALPIQQYTPLPEKQVRELVAYKLALVGLSDYMEYYPAQLSGGMAKRAALARAIVLDPELLFFDEPSAGLDPPSSRLLDQLIVQLSEALGATVVIVSHELSSILSIGTDCVFLDAASKTMLDQGNPRELRAGSAHESVQRFLRAETGQEEPAAQETAHG